MYEWGSGSALPESSKASMPILCMPVQSLDMSHYSGGSPDNGVRLNLTKIKGETY